MEDRWLSMKEISEYFLGGRRETILRWLAHRNFPGHQIGKLWKFKASEVDTWVKNDNQAINNHVGRETKV